MSRRPLPPFSPFSHIVILRLTNSKTSVVRSPIVFDFVKRRIRPLSQFKFYLLKLPTDLFWRFVLPVHRPNSPLL